MLTRPLDLVSHLRTEPRNFSALFYVCAGMIALQFALFGSRFVLSPGLQIQTGLPVVSKAALVPTSHRISIGKSGGIVTSDGPMTDPEFSDWLRNEAARTKEPGLLVQADSGVSMGRVSRVFELAQKAGVPVTLATDVGPEMPPAKAK